MIRVPTILVTDLDTNPTYVLKTLKSLQYKIPQNILQTLIKNKSSCKMFIIWIQTDT